MGAKSWEPASRYEFQARLISKEKWTPEQVADRFGRKKTEVLRDLKAQTLYQDFRAFEERTKLEHTLTYNAFAEAARAPSVMKWLGWSSDRMAIANTDRESSFFHYLLSRLRSRSKLTLGEGEEETPDESAESIVRRLRDMLKLEDEEIEGALLDRDFDAADISYEQKREGTFAKRVASFTRTLKRVTGEELQTNTAENIARLRELEDQVKLTSKILTALSRS